MIDFKNTESLVEEILTKYPFTRNSDRLLECMIVQELGYGEYLFTEVMIRSKELGIPNFATIERTRRKIQAKNSSLKADENVEEERFNLQNEYTNYAIDKVLL